MVNHPSNHSRRDFLRLAASVSAAAGGGLGLASVAAAGTRARLGAAPRPASAPLKILILGGTAFLGPAIIDAARARGHSITTFNRGRTEKRKGVAVDAEEKLVGNRDPDKHAATKFVDGKDVDDTDSPKGLSQLEGHTWDAVVDTSGYAPRIVKASAEFLSKSVKQYVFISSISAYKQNDKVGADETSPVATMADETIEEMGAGFANYGPLKALCEQAAEKAMAGRVTNIRPGFIVGPEDATDRFTYWPIRIDRGGEVLVPGSPSDLIQIIDVRDLGEWIVHCIEAKVVGVFNACGPEKKLAWGDVLEACRQNSEGGKKSKLIWIATSQFEAIGVPQGTFPIWVPPEGESAGFHTYSIARAVAAGLKFRPYQQTCKDLLTWWPKEVERRRTAGERQVAEAKKDGRPEPKLPPADQLRAGPQAATEAELLAKIAKTATSSPAPAETTPPADPKGK